MSSPPGSSTDPPSLQTIPDRLDTLSVSVDRVGQKQLDFEGEFSEWRKVFLDADLDNSVHNSDSEEERGPEGGQSNLDGAYIQRAKVLTPVLRMDLRNTI